MEDVGHSAGCTSTSVDGPKVAFDQLDVFEYVGKVSAVPSRKIIEDANALSLCEQRTYNIVAYEAGSTSH